MTTAIAAPVRHAYRPGRYTLAPCFRCAGKGSAGFTSRELSPGRWESVPYPCDACGATGTVAHRYPTLEEVSDRWPCLVRCASWAALLGDTEALSAIRDYIGNREHAHRTGGCEAVAHFGGPRAVILAAVAARRAVRILDGGRFRRAVRLARFPAPGSCGACYACVNADGYCLRSTARGSL